MSRVQIALGCVVVATGLGLSIVLLPGDKELALINMKGENYGQALASYEIQLKRKGPVMSVVMPLARAYLHFGDVDKAISAMERFVARNPDHIEARKRLGLFFKYAYRRDDYVRNLREIIRLSPDAASLRELLRIYDVDGRHEKRLATLEILVEGSTGKADDFLDLARLRAAFGRLNDAVRTLETLERKFPAALSLQAAQLRVSLMIDTGQAKAALPWAQAYVAGNHVPEYAMGLAAIFTGKGALDATVALLDGFSADPQAFPALFAMIIETEMARGRPLAATRRLKAAYRARRLDLPGRELLIELALRADDYAIAFAVAQSRNPASLRKGLIVDLVTAGLESGKLTLVNALLAKLGSGGFEEPVLQARLALAQGDRAAALKWAHEAGRQPDLALEQRLALATIYRRLNMDRRALTMLAAIADAVETPEWALSDLASLYVQLDRAAEGYEVFLTIRKQRESRAADLGWALLAIATGRSGKTLNWLGEVGIGQLDGNALRTLYFAAIESKSASLAVRLAKEGYRREPDRSRRRMLADALVVSGRPGDALIHYRRLASNGENDPDFESNYLAALTAALNNGAPVRDELRKFLIAKLAKPGVSEARRVELVYGLIEIKAHGDALPWLKTWARRDGGKWFFAYMDAADKAGLEQETIAFLVERARRPGLTAEERRGLAFRLLDVGARKPAERLFRDLAEHAAPDSQDVIQFLHLRGPRPGETTLVWLEERARASSGQAERAVWARYLIDAGEAMRAAAVIGEAPPTAGREGPLLWVWLEALSASRNRAGLAEIIEIELAATTSPKRIRRLARLASEADVTKPASAAYDALLIAMPDDPEALRYAGRMAFLEGRFSVARISLERYLKLKNDPLDYLSLYYLAEIRYRDKHANAAGRLYKRALRIVENGRRTDVAARETEAWILHRLNRTGEALVQLEGLLKESPRNLNIRASLTRLLLEAGQYQRARAVLSAS